VASFLEFYENSLPYRYTNLLLQYADEGLAPTCEGSVSFQRNGMAEKSSTLLKMISPVVEMTQRELMQMNTVILQLVA